MPEPEIPLNEIEVVLLSPVYDLSKFDCGDADLNEFIQKDALVHQKNALARTSLFIWKGQIIGFCSLCCDSIRLKESEKAEESIAGEIRHPEYPAVKLARFARDKQFAGRRIGNMILRYAIATALQVNEKCACLFMTVDAYHHKVGWYEARGFVRNQHSAYDGKENVSMRFNLNPLPSPFTPQPA